ncbi:hypothetical protein lbkm_4142 [Lachnospiraceae bacterium KM106-2]|nr:hypothetical protein lbkm_4142 [Lachnospiraceae bacterium KM106-2]
MKKGKLKHILLKLVLPIVIGGVFGVAIAMSTVSLFEDDITVLFVMLAAMYGFMFIHIVLHEAGHMVAGLCTGYHVASFRIGSFILVKREGKWCVKRYNIPGTMGQCLMDPPEMKEGRIPFVFYNLGGVLVNLVLGAISILLLWFVPQMNNYWKSINFMNIVMAVLVLVQNGIPMKIGGVPNDAYNIKMLHKEDAVQKVFYLQLKTYALLVQGQKWSELPFEWFDIPLSEENSFYTSLKLMEYNWYLDAHQFDEARNVLEELKKAEATTPKLYQHILNGERMFLELLGENRQEVIESIVTPEFESFLKQGKYMVSVQRAKYAYERLYKKDRESARKIYPHLKKLIAENPAIGELELEAGLLELIESKAKEDGDSLERPE